MSVTVGLVDVRRVNRAKSTEDCYTCKNLTSKTCVNPNPLRIEIPTLSTSIGSDIVHVGDSNPAQWHRRVVSTPPNQIQDPKIKQMVCDNIVTCPSNRAIGVLDIS